MGVCVMKCVLKSLHFFFKKLTLCHIYSFHNALVSGLLKVIFYLLLFSWIFWAYLSEESEVKKKVKKKKSVIKRVLTFKR